MTKDEAIQEACEIVALAVHSIGDYADSNDGFCRKCPFADQPENYRNSGAGLKYVRLAVLKQLKRDGHKIADGFSGKTGRPKERIKQWHTN